MTAIANLFQVQKAWLKCKRCGLHKHRDHVRFGRRVGTIDYGGLLVIDGVPNDGSLGPSRRKLDQLLAKTGIESIYVTNTVCCRPPEDRDPTRKEVKACAPRLKNVIDSLKPSAIVTTGKVSSNLFLQTDRPMRSLLGSTFDVGGIPVVPVYHPAFLLRKHQAHLDQQFVRRLQLVVEEQDG